ncbi:ATP synthase F1 subunit gamma [Candidatus Bipolaricaulota bacterium]|nr:ATP synthase F1 subunit gamma [Candidatus Bipolaricaulota bacterium]
MAKKLRQLRRRIRNIQHIRDIAKAMYTIASSQIIQRKKELFPARVFPTEAIKILGDLRALARANHIYHPLLEGHGRKGLGLLVVNADRGLCGRYVADVNEAALRFVQERGEAKLILVGDKAIRFLGRHWPAAEEFRRLERPRLSHAQTLTEKILALYEEVGEVHAVYTEFRGDLVQRVRVERLLPIPVPERPAWKLLVEPDLWTAIEGLGKIWLLGRIYQILLEAKTAEHAARRQAMKNATDNADEILEKLTIQYNKARQQSITLELMDIMGGAEAIREEL